ncbi:MAG: hypothetical protein JWO93_3348 [Micrococcaceae bacterium]|jgi:hypothetical protein|nr:hypothetical protein [Micrococcaceae bacterium]
MSNNLEEPDATDNVQDTNRTGTRGADSDGAPALSRVSGTPDDSADVHTNSLTDPAGLETEALGEQDAGRSRDGA